jgi:hypothetical protein
VHQEATVSDNYSDPAAHMTPIISNLRGLVRGSDWSDRFRHRKGMKLCRFLKSSPPRSITTPGELPFQEGRPLPPSDDEDEGQVARSAKHFAPNREVFMIHTGEDCEGIERVQLDNYHDYLLDPFDEDVDVTMGIEFPENIKIEDADDIHKEHRKLINAKRAERKHRVIETNQPGGGGEATPTAPPRATFAPSSMLAGMLAMSSLPSSWSTKRWKPTAPPIIKSLSTT